MADETAWLIERADPRNPGCVMAGSFLGVQGSYDGLNGSGRLEWMDSARDAIRFARQQDAAMFIGMMVQLADNQRHGETLPGLRSGDPRALAVEHMWCAP